MKSFKLGSVAGIPIQVHWSFLLLVAWVLFASLATGATWPAAVASVGFVLVLFGCVLLHELGHALAAARFGIPTRDITLLPIGGVARLERMPRKPSQELIVALAGPAVNVIIAGLLFLVLASSGNIPSSDSLAAGGTFLQRLMVVNIALVVFNLLPAFPMDGGRVLRAVAGMFTNYTQATRIAAAVGQVFAIGFALLGLINPFLFLIAAFVFLGAAAEYRQVAMQERLSGLDVGDGMLRRFRVVPPHAALRELTEQLLDGSQRDYPVIQEGVLVGMLRRPVLLSSLHQTQLTVEEAMDKAVEPVEESDPLLKVVEQRASTDVQSVPVVREGALVGLLDFGQAMELAEARALALQLAKTEAPVAARRTAPNVA